MSSSDTRRSVALALLAAVESAALQVAARRANLRQCRWVELRSSQRGCPAGGGGVYAADLLPADWEAAAEEMEMTLALETTRLLSSLPATAPPLPQPQPQPADSPLRPTATPIPSADCSSRVSLGVKRPYCSLGLDDAIGTPRMAAIVSDMPQGGTLFRRVFDMTGGSGVSALLSAPTVTPLQLRASPTRLTAAVQAVTTLAPPTPTLGSAAATGFGAGAAASSAQSRVRSLISQFESHHATPKRSGAPAQDQVPVPSAAIRSGADNNVTPLRSGGRLVTAQVPASVQLWSARRDAASKMANIQEVDEDESSHQRSEAATADEMNKQLQRTTGTPIIVQRLSVHDAAPAEEEEEDAISAFLTHNPAQNNENLPPGTEAEAAAEAENSQFSSEDAEEPLVEQEAVGDEDHRREEDAEEAETRKKEADLLEQSSRQRVSVERRDVLSADPTALWREQKKKKMFVKLCLQQQNLSTDPPPPVIPVKSAPAAEEDDGRTSVAVFLSAGFSPPSSKPSQEILAPAAAARGSQIPQRRPAGSVLGAALGSAASRVARKRSSQELDLVERSPSKAVVHTPKPPKVQRMHRLLKPLGEKNWEDQADLSDDEGLPPDGRRRGLRTASWAKDSAAWHALVKQQEDIDPRSIFGCGTKEANFKDLFKTPDFKRAETEMKFSRAAANASDLSSFDARKDRHRKWNADKKHCGFAPHEGVPVTDVRKFKHRVGQVRDVSHLVWDAWSVCQGNCQHDSTVRQPWYQKLELSPGTTSSLRTGGSSMRRCGSPLPAARTLADPELSQEVESGSARREPDSLYRGIFCTTVWN